MKENAIYALVAILTATIMLSIGMICVKHDQEHQQYISRQQENRQVRIDSVKINVKDTFVRDSIISRIEMEWIND